MELYQDAGYFFDRFRNPHTPDFNDLVERELVAAVDRMRSEGPSDDDHQRALACAYPNPPEGVREMIHLWECDERANRGPAPVDLLLDSYYTLCKMMRLAFEDREYWLTEILEHERQETAARAACALQVAGLRPAG